MVREKIERLKAEVQHLRQEKALLVERLALSFPQKANLEALRHQVLKELKLGILPLDTKLLKKL